VERSRPLYWRCYLAPETFKTAMRIGDWKILADEALTTFELYNIDKDPNETKEMSQQEPAKFAQMKADLIQLNQEIEAEGPDWWKNYGKGSAKAKNPKAPGRKGAKAAAQ
ncbi:MAG: hypothetical protein ACK53L_09440, partial [Pirellulaceae bacterium]